MQEHPNARLVREGYEEFLRGDVEANYERYAEDAVWHVPGRGPLSGTYRGRKAIFEDLFAKVERLSAGAMSYELHDVVANDHHAVALHRSRGQRGGKKLDNLECIVFHIVDGKAVEIWSHVFDVHANDEFWSD